MTLPSGPDAVPPGAAEERAALSGALTASPDGRFLYVGGYNDGGLAILRLQGEKLMSVGAFKLPGHPASLRGNTP